MSRVGELGLTEIGVEASGALREIVTRSLGSAPVATYVTEQPLAWDVIRQGDWDLLGVPESDGGAGASLRDLAEIARVWGWSIAPSPLIPSLLSKRWSSAAREHAGPVTFATLTRTSAGRGVSPFGVDSDVALLVDLDGSLAKASGISVDDYAPSLRVVECAEATRWTPEAARELTVVWAAEASGCASRMLQDAIAYAKERHQFGQPIGRFQAIKHHLANAHMLAEQAETAAIVASLEPERSFTASQYGFEASLRVIEIAIQVHGGLGFTWEMGLHVYLRHVSALREMAAGLRA